MILSEGDRINAELFWFYTCLHPIFASGFVPVLDIIQGSSLGEPRASTKFMQRYR